MSAFGGNRANGLSPDTENIEDLRQTWDGKSEPQNVLPMLIRISEMAEEGRYKLLRERFDNASIVARTLKWPFSWSRVRGLGANKEEDRRYCVKNLVQCVARLGAFALISAFFVFCAVSTACSLNVWIGLCGYDKKLSSAEQSCKGDSEFVLGKDVIKDLSDSRPRQMGGLVFFCDQKLNGLKERYEHLEDKRNWRVFKSAQKDCSGLELRDGGDDMDVDERLKRFYARIARYQNATNEIFGSETRITGDGNLASRGTENLLSVEKLSQIIAAEIKGKSDFEGDKPFYQGLRKVRSAQTKDFCKEAEAFLGKYQSTKEHLKDKCEQIKKEWEWRERELTGDTDKYLAQHADDPESENYQDRISRAELRINKVEELFEQSSTRLPCKKKYEEGKERDGELVQNLKADAPFYDALKKLREDNTTTATGRVRRIYAFLDQYKGYGRCERFMAPLRRELSNEVCRIQNECRTAVTNNRFDAPGITTGKKIERIKNQIRVYEDARDEYVIGSVEYSSAEKVVKQLRETLVAAQNLNGFENALNRIRESSYKGRLKALAELKDEYKDNLGDEQKKEIEKLEKDAFGYWQDYQRTNERCYDIKDEDALNVQMRNVVELEKVYSMLKEEVLPNSSQYAQLEQKEKESADRKRSIERDQKLANEFHALPSTNAVERCLLLNAIDAFELTYHIADYTSKHGKDVFRQLKQRKDEAQRAFWSDYTNQIAKVQCPSETNFLGRCQWADACMKISAESYTGLGSNNVIRLQLEADHKDYDTQHQRFAKLFGLASYANEIAGKSPTNDVEVACGRLREIKKFYSDYPPDNNQDPLVGAYYLRVKNTLAENNEVVSRHIDMGLREMDGKLPYGAPDEDKLKVWNEKKDLIGKYILVFVKETDPHRVYTQKLAELNKQYGITQRKVLFENGYKQLDAEIKNEPDLKRKQEKIEEFLAKNEDVCLNDFARDKIQALKKEAGRIEKDIEYNVYNDKVDEVIGRRPAVDAGDDVFVEFKAQVVSLQENLGKFKQIPHLKRRCVSIDQKLKEQLEYVKKALGDGGWKYVQKMEEKYKTNPCKDTETKLRSALNNFDAVAFSGHLQSKEMVEKNFNTDIDMRKKVSLAKAAFFDNPSHSTFVEFKNAVDGCRNWENGELGREGYGCKWPFLDDCSKYISKIQNGIQVKLVVESVAFSGSWKKAGVRVADRPVCELFKGYGRYDFGVVTVDFSGLCFSIKYENMAAYREVSRTMSFWELLKEGAASGCCQTSLSFEVIEKMLGRDPEKHIGTLGLNVQDIPYMQ